MRNIIALFLLIFMFISCKNEQLSQVYYSKAQEYYSRQEYALALENVTMCLNKNRNFHQAELLKAKIFYFSDNDKESLKILKSLVRKYPEYTEARIWKIRLLISLKQYDIAQLELDKELSFNPTDWRLYYQYSLLADKKEQLDKRLAMLNKALLYISESYNVFIESADVWIKLGMKDKAIECLDKAMSISKEDKILNELKTYLMEGNK